MTDVWEEVPRNEYYKTFKEVVECPGFGLRNEGDVFLTKEMNDNVIDYFYELEGRFYAQNFAVWEVKSMKIKREEGRKTLLIGYYENAGYEYKFNQICKKVPHYYGCDCEYKLYLNDKQVEVERLGILFPPEMKRKTDLL